MSIFCYFQVFQSLRRIVLLSLCSNPGREQKSYHHYITPSDLNVKCTIKDISTEPSIFVALFMIHHRVTSSSFSLGLQRLCLIPWGLTIQTIGKHAQQHVEVEGDRDLLLYIATGGKFRGNRLPKCLSFYTEWPTAIWTLPDGNGSQFQ